MKISSREVQSSSLHPLLLFTKNLVLKPIKVKKVKHLFDAPQKDAWFSKHKNLKMNLRVVH